MLYTLMLLVLRNLDAQLHSARFTVVKRASGTSSLEEPLLSPEQNDLSQPTTSSHNEEDTRRAIVPHSINKYDWEDLWRSLVAGCVQTCTTAWRKAACA